MLQLLIILAADSSVVELEIGWVLGTIGTLGGVIAALAATLWTSMKERLTTQDRIIDGMREDITRMSKGCGQDLCHWSSR